MASIFKLRAMLEEARKTDAEMPLHYLSSLLAVISKPGLHQSDLETETGFSRAAVSRIVTKLTEGYGFIRRQEDPENRVKNQLFPTPAGERFVKRLLEILA